MTCRTLLVLLGVATVLAIGLPPVPLDARGGRGPRRPPVGKSAVESFVTNLEREMSRREQEDRVNGGRRATASAAFEEMTLSVLAGDRVGSTSRR